jgi:hypothetical protein
VQISESVYRHQQQQQSSEQQHHVLQMPSAASQVLSARDALLAWARRITGPYGPEVNVTNFSGSWKDGLAFCALLHHFRPDLVNWENVRENFENLIISKFTIKHI